MSREAALKEAMQLEPEDRIELAMDLWDSVAEEAAALPLSDATKAELERRRAAHEANPSAAIPWEQVREELRRRL